VAKPAQREKGQHRGMSKRAEHLSAPELTCATTNDGGTRAEMGTDGQRDAGDLGKGSTRELRACRIMRQKVDQLPRVVSVRYESCMRVVQQSKRKDSLPSSILFDQLRDTLFPFHPPIHRRLAVLLRLPNEQLPHIVDSFPTASDLIAHRAVHCR